MTTVVNNPSSGTTERVVESTDTGGWAVAVVILLAVVAIGAFVWVRYYQQPAAATPAPASTGSTNINVTLPPATTPPVTGSANGSAGAATQ